ncbi:MAG: hypothetical protein ABIP75_00595 [Pyrinomonadaceae bacterium]
MNVPVITTDSRKRETGRLAGGSPSGGQGPFDDGRSGGGSSARQGLANMLRIGMYAVMLAVTMTFTALSSAYVYLVAKPHFWKPISMPPLVWVSTVLILLSSASLVHVIRSIQRAELKSARTWLNFAWFFGLGFLASQAGAWFELSRQGLLEAGNQQRSFFLILSAAHAAHLLAGLAALLYLRSRVRHDAISARISLLATARPISLFWHFLAGIWLFLLALLLLWK